MQSVARTKLFTEKAIQMLEFHFSLKLFSCEGSVQTLFWKDWSSCQPQKYANFLKLKKSEPNYRVVVLKTNRMPNADEMFKLVVIDVAW